MAGRTGIIERVMNNINETIIKLLEKRGIPLSLHTKICGLHVKNYSKRKSLICCVKNVNQLLEN